MTSKNTAEDARFFSNVSVLQSGQDLQPATYDLIILPGYGFVGDNWELSGHVKQRTSLAAALYQKASRQR